MPIFWCGSLKLWSWKNTLCTKCFSHFCLKFFSINIDIPFSQPEVLKKLRFLSESFLPSVATQITEVLKKLRFLSESYLPSVATQIARFLASLQPSVTICLPLPLFGRFRPLWNFFYQYARFYAKTHNFFQSPVKAINYKLLPDLAFVLGHMYFANFSALASFFTWPHEHSLYQDWSMFSFLTGDRPIWFFWGRYRYIGHSWTDSRYW